MGVKFLMISSSAKIRSFAEEEIKPLAFLMDQNNEFPEEAVKKLGKLELEGLTTAVDSMLLQVKFDNTLLGNSLTRKVFYCNPLIQCSITEENF